jgi:hypothetical protein
MRLIYFFPFISLVSAAESPLGTPLEDLKRTGFLREVSSNATITSTEEDLLRRESFDLNFIPDYLKKHLLEEEERPQPVTTPPSPKVLAQKVPHPLLESIIFFQSLGITIDENSKRTDLLKEEAHKRNILELSVRIQALYIR